MSDVQVDPAALSRFAGDAAAKAQELAGLSAKLHIDASALGDFEEATELVDALNQQLRVVVDRVHTASLSLYQLSTAASSAATLTQQSDADVAASMRSIEKALQTAETTLHPATGSGAGAV